MRDQVNKPDEVHRDRWITLVVLCVSLLVIVLDNTILNVALPRLSSCRSRGGLGASQSQLQWIVDSYTIVFAGLLLTTGTIGDRFGRYRFLTVGLIVFGIGSASLRHGDRRQPADRNRALMGVGGAFIMPATLSILTNVFTEPRERQGHRNLGGGVRTWSGRGARHRWLSSGALLVGLDLPGQHPRRDRRADLRLPLHPRVKDPNPSKADPLGALLSIAALGVLLAAVIEAPAHGWTSPEILAGFATGIALFVGFMVWEMRCDHPMLNLEFFKNPRFSAASAAITLTFLGLFGMIFLLTQYLQSVLGYSTIKAGAVLLPQAVVIMIAAPLSSIWVNRLGNKVVVAGGLTVCGLAFLTFTQLTVTTPMVPVILLTCLLGLGMGNVMAPATDSIMGSLPRAKAGVGSAMNDTTRQTGGAVGVAVLGSLLSSRYAPEMTAKLTGKVPEQFIQPLTDSIGKTLGIAEKAPSAVRPLIESAARESFVSGMHLASIVAAGILFVAALSVVKWLPARVPRRRAIHHGTSG